MDNVVIIVGVLAFTCFEEVLSELVVGLILDYAGLHELSCPAYKWNLGTIKEGHVDVVGSIWL